MSNRSPDVDADDETAEANAGKDESQDGSVKSSEKDEEEKEKPKEESSNGVSTRGRRAVRATSNTEAKVTEAAEPEKRRSSGSTFPMLFRPVKK
jgi:hypothetical protein